MLSKKDWQKLDRIYTDPVTQEMWREWYGRLYDKRRVRRALRNLTKTRW